MGAVVNVGSIFIGSTANATGIFNGQNMQNDWDSHSSNMSTLGTMSGNRSIQASLYTVLWSTAVIGQPVLDQDIKANGSPLIIGP